MASGEVMSPAELLGLQEGANEAEVTAAFRRFARQHHPDAGGDPGVFRSGVAAYRQLRSESHATAGPEVTFVRRRKRRWSQIGTVLGRLRRTRYIDLT